MPGPFCDGTTKAVGAVILPSIGGWVGASFVNRNHNMKWYESLQRPSWCPPKSAFGPVWTALYSGMGYSSYLVWRDGGGFSGAAKLPLALYGGHLALNWAFTPIFFGLRSIRGGLIDIILLDFATIGTAVAFYGINKMAGLFFIPYIAWLSLATSLQYVIYRDNPKEIEEGKAEK